MADPAVEQVPLHRQGHHLLPHAVLAGDAALQRPQGARRRVRARLHHRQRREDEQEPRHRHRAAALPGARHERRMAALLHRRQAQRKVEDIDFNPDDFIARVNSDLVGKYINIASRAAGFLAKRFGGRVSADLGVEGRALLDALARTRRRHRRRCTRSASSARRCARSCCWPTASTSTSTSTSRGSWPRRPAATTTLHDVCSVVHRGLPAADALPEAGACRRSRAQVEAFLQHRAPLAWRDAARTLDPARTRSAPTST